MDRWKFEIRDINFDPSTFIAEPTEELYEYVNEAVKSLQRKIALCEEKMIFDLSPTDVLERIRDVCIELIAKRESAQQE